MYMHDWGWGGHWFGMFTWWIVIVFAIVFVALFSNIANRSPRDLKRKATALEILEQRYARGEINDQEFDRMRTNLLSREQHQLSHTTDAPVK